ncbi:MAG TPA: (Fe-S)-binding protein [Anaerolineae bacterium]|nr:(Fe-S)-binding protein [Anaerolineae bacterium]
MMANDLSAYSNFLFGCRFCPMCKPAGEVANLTMLESHTTRARAMMLWRIANDLATWGSREVELLYQSTLDSISQAWCVNHYPVSEYMAVARVEVFRAGLAPESVQQALQRTTPEPVPVNGDVLLLASEAAELGDAKAYQPALQALARAGVQAKPLVAASGALTYSLGDRQCARDQATRVVDLIQESNAWMVIADSPQTLWALHRIYPVLEVSLPTGVTVTSLSEHLARAVQEGRLTLPRHDGERIFFHDSRSACLVADEMAQAEVIQPGYRGPEETLGKGEVYDAPRRLVDNMGMERLCSVWSRSLSKSCGADDGLWLIYPKLAEGLARQRLQEAKQLGAELIITDSVLCARHLARAAEEGDVHVHWLPELLAA